MTQRFQRTKHVFKQCLWCKYVNNKPAQATVTAELTDSCVVSNHVFEVIGVYYEGILDWGEVCSSNNDVHIFYSLPVRSVVHVV